MYKDYLDAIMKFYARKKAENDLPPRLLNPTPSKLRDECAAVFRTRFEKKDQPRLMSFFEVSEGVDILKAIERFDIDKFRPLNNYLKEMTEKTDDKNVELLGWLINFPKRPYNKHDFPGLDLNIEEEADLSNHVAYTKRNENLEQIEPLKTNFLKTASSVEKIAGLKSPDLAKRLKFLGGSFVIASGILAAVHFNSKDDKHCMVWINDRYQAISCDSSSGGGLIVPKDENVLRHMRRITRPDTLTAKDIRNVWYRKRRADSLDYFTMGGRDPLDPNVELKRMTIYILEKHLLKNELIDSAQGQ